MTKTTRRKFIPIVLAAIATLIAVSAPIGTARAAVVGGNTFANVAAVQARLSTLGYYGSSVDGVWGNGTLSAVKRFQSDYGLKSDGVVGSATAKKLNLTFPVSGGISRGKTTANVAAVQARLRTYGYYKSAVDGAWGNRTVAAVLKYQSDKGLKADGVVGNGTAGKLGITLSSSSRNGGISAGNTAANVKAVQTALKKAGYYASTVDGAWGGRTMCAVMAFQSDSKLAVDGVVGSSTLKALGVTLGGSNGGTSSGNVSSSDLNLLARCVYGEARGEPYNGQVAVAAVVLNRVHSSKFPNSISGVIYQKGAFTAVDDGQINLAPDDNAYRAARDALNGWDPTGGCLYYYNPATATSSWIWSLTVHIRIGKHNFAL